MACFNYELLDTNKMCDFQNLVTRWSKQNFGPHYQTGYRNLIGVMEELGELAHAHLKGEQNIRHTPEEILKLKKDAIGDIIVFLCNYADSQNIDVSECMEIVWEEIQQRDWTKYKQDGVKS